jgi:LPS sulfotransferase NodH
MKNVKLNDRVSQGFVADGYTPKKSHVELFERLKDCPNNVAPVEKSLLILSTPRCGSALFCEALNSSGKLGLAEEWFNYEYFAAWAHVMKTTFKLRDYVEWVQRKSTGGTGVFVLNWHVGQLVDMNQDFNLGIESMDFDQIIYLYRRDKIAQAVSLCKAVTSNQFRSYEERTSKPKTSNHGIASALEAIIKFDQFARKYLWKYIDVSYAYEDFRRLGSQSTKPHPCYAATLAAFDKHPSYCYGARGLKKQGGVDNIEIGDEFLSYITGEYA